MEGIDGFDADFFPVSPRKRLAPIHSSDWRSIVAGNF